MKLVGKALLKRFFVGNHPIVKLGGGVKAWVPFYKINKMLM